MLDELLLLSGNDIPFEKAKLIIHQPTLKEIAYIGEEPFFIGCELLNFSKDILSSEDKNDLRDSSNFEVFMSIMADRQNTMLKRNRTCAMMVLALIFPEYRMQMTSTALVFTQVDDEENSGELNNDNFDDFKAILNQMFCLDKTKGDAALNYNPQDARSRKIAEKLQEGRRKAAEAKKEPQKVSVFSRYISI
ncbi:MAG: hypothetical protein LUC37_02880, partial [Prevotella sp.]|nr:hypothetical protein [Prevotella sp.]